MAMNSNEIIIPCRLSYCHLFEAHSVNGSDPKYSVCCLIDKGDKRTIQRLTALIEKVKQNSASKWGGKIPKTLKLPLRDGDEEREGAEYKNQLFLNANSSSERPPKVIDAALNDVLDRGEVYSGCYANVKLSLFAYDSNGNRGIACGLVAVQKTRDGERLGGSDSGLEGFGALDESELDADGPDAYESLATQVRTPRNSSMDADGPDAYWFLG